MSDSNRISRFSGLVFAPDGSQSGSRRVDMAGDLESETVQLTYDDKFEYLMSLALDNMLEADEAALFDEMLAELPQRDEIWNDWQLFDSEFRRVPAVEPPVNFVASFEQRLSTQQRRKRLWLGIAFGAAAIFLWIGLVMGLLGAGAYVMLNQSDWLTAGVRFAVYGSATVQSYITMVMDAANAALGSTELQIVAVVYLLVGTLAIWAWSRFLRRSIDGRYVGTRIVS